MIATRWPQPLADAAFHGVLGDIVLAIAPQTEADAAGILTQLLAMFGDCAGRSPHFTVGADRHHLNLYVAIVGLTAKGRKGMAKNEAQRIFLDLDEEWTRHRIVSGLSSGEGLIAAVRDPVTRQHPIKEKGHVVTYEEIIEDPGVDDKRLLVVESELASAFAVMKRDGNTLSEVIRKAWDGQDLGTLTKASSLRATAPHIAVIGHITADELRRKLEETETANGFGNRFLWVLVKRSKNLPHGGKPVNLDPYVPALHTAITTARRGPTMERDPEANEYWEARYDWLSTGRPGMLGSMTARAEAHVMRLACLYALADGEPIVSVAHLQAAFAIWKYCYESAAILFGDRVGDRVADAILAELRRRAPERITRTEISELFNRNKPASELNRALELLQQYRLAWMELDREANGRPVERWGLLTDEMGLKDEIESPDSQDSRSNEIDEIDEVTPGRGGPYFG